MREQAWMRASHSARAEPTLRSVGTRQYGRLDEFGLHIALNHQLRNTVARFEHRGVFRIEIDQRHLDLTAISGIYSPGALSTVTPCFTANPDRGCTRPT